jgi:hypothetical protein
MLLIQLGFQYLDYVTSNYRMSDEGWIGKDLKETAVAYSKY